MMGRRQSSVGGCVCWSLAICLIRVEMCAADCIPDWNIEVLMCFPCQLFPVKSGCSCFYSVSLSLSLTHTQTHTYTQTHTHTHKHTHTDTRQHSALKLG